jgi:rhodanese-related sulfurtransferase
LPGLPIDREGNRHVTRVTLRRHHALDHGSAVTASPERHAKDSIMKALSCIVPIVLAALVLCASATVSADAWSDAQQAFADYDDRAALVHLRRAAEEGDDRARLALGLALRHAKRLFPGVLEGDPAAAAKWLAQALPPQATLPESQVPASKRTRAGLYLTPSQALALKSTSGAKVVFLDVRTRAEAAYVGMPESVDALVPYLEHDEFMSEWDDARGNFRVAANGRFAADVGRALARQGLGRDAVIVLICRSGDRSAKAADLLFELGHTQVHSVVDGFEGDLSAEGRRTVNGWKNAGLPWSYRLERNKALFGER